NYDSVADAAGAEKIIKTAVDTFGYIDILVNNAGILRDRMSFNMTTEEWDAVLKVHLYGNFYCSKYAGIMFRQQKRGGRIISTSSVAALGNMGQANYAAAKAGILGLVYTFALELGRYGVTANGLFPAAATRMTASKELQEAWDRQAATGSITQEALSVRKTIMEMKPEAVAEVVAYLATDEAANINGYIFEIAGNRVSLFSKMAAITGIIKKEGYWTCEELSEYIPKTMGGYLINPSPPQPSK
ncbi:MAG: SDR family oxidoreductase, partial [Dehalococcoidia bacterium]|nr:SDR family oxidoreductase [Dehalococcoidia bacterium]